MDRPNPALGLTETPFYVNTQTRPWVRTRDQPRRASVSSFGFGGSNFHVTLEEYRGEQRAKRLRTLPTELVVLSGSTEADLQKRSADIVSAVRGGEGLARIAFDAAREFDASQPARAGLVAADIASLEALAEKLHNALADGTASALKDPNIFVGFGPAREGKTAFLFPGQGSQYVGMGGDLALEFPEALAVWDGLDDDLADLHGVVFPEPAFDAATVDAQKAELTAMENAQPAIAATSLAQLALLDVLGVSADAAAGHSFGEVTALAAAGVIPAERLVEAARMRGVLMAAAGEGRDGAMLAIAASAEDVRRLLDSLPESTGSLVIANDNAPNQVVLAGLAPDIARAETAAKSAGWTSRRLPVASAFHSEVVASSSAPLGEYLKTLKLGEPNFPVYANTTAQPYGQQVVQQLADQVRQPVKFREMIEAMAHDDVTRFIEVGPGRVLTGLVDKILDTTPHIAVALDSSKADGLRGWHRGLAALAADGVALDLVSLFDHYDEPAKHVPPAAHAVLVGGANLGKPYPPADGKKSITPKRVRTNVASARPEVKQPAAEGPALTQSTQRMEPPALQPVAVSAPTVHVPEPAIHVPEPEVHVHAPEVIAPLSGDAWSVIDRIQKETAEQHHRYLDVMTQSHQAFLDMSAQMLVEIVGDHSGVTQAPRTVHNGVTVASGPVPNAVLPSPNIVAATVIPVEQAFASAPVVIPAPSPPPQSPVSPVAGVRPSTPSAPSQSSGDVVLAIVSEKTGYPADMLSLEMEMEAELGIDSIKQVEILAALQAKYPGAPDIPASELAGLRTLQDVVDTVGGFTNGATAAVAAPPSAPAAPALPAGDVVLAIVSEKTGYPADMLSLEMEMEAELGIDSIKQVEILAALQAKYPGAPDIPASELAGLRTLQDVVDTVGGFTNGATAAVAAPPSAPAAPALPAGDVVLAIVSEKTGYPADMLSLEMEMEAELGIDSIKQVEILAALQAKYPGAPDIPASELAGLRTLQDVVDTVGGFTNGATAAVAAPPSAPAAPALPAGDVVLAIVSEKTGYPADMLSLEMEMEAELGIDSIKQVEILAALQAKYPGAPDIPASELAGLRTLQDVVDTVGGFTNGTSFEHSGSAAESTPSGSPSGGLSCTEAELRPVPPSGFAMAGLRDGEVFITREDPAFADTLERVMISHGIKAKAVDDLPDEASAVISLAALAAAESPQDCVDMHVRAFHAARSVAKSDSESRLFVTIQSTGATFAEADAPTGVASLVKTAAWEWPNASVRAIDIESLDAERLVAELLEGGSGVEVALRADGTRLVAVDDVESSVGEGETISVAEGGVVVVTGGARGVTASSALALAKRHGLRLALLGRTPLREATAEEPSGSTVTEIATALAASARARGEQLSLPQARAQAESLMAEQEVRATLATAQQQGTPARYFSANITDRAELDTVLDEVRQNFGPIVGVVHGAGVLADKRLEDLDDDQFIRVFSTKLVGGRVTPGCDIIR